MANRDYVRKKPATDKKKPVKRAASKRTTSNSSQEFPWKMAFVGLLLLVGLVWLIIKLSSDPEPTMATAPKTPPTPNKEATKTQTIPPLPEERWEYIESLPKREVEIKEKELKVSKIPYIMQCGAYKTKNSAGARKANIALNGIQSKIVKKSGSNWYRVILGPYKFKRDAVKDQHTLQLVKIEPCVIMRENAI